MKFTVGKKIISGFAILIILLIALGALGIGELALSNNKIENIYENHLKGIQSIEEANINLVARDRAEKNMILASNNLEIDQHAASVKKHAEDFTLDIAIVKDTIVTEEGKTKLQEILKSWETIIPLQEKMIEYSSQNKDNEAYEMSKQIRTIVDDIEKEIDSLASLKVELAKTDYDESKAAFQNTLIMTIILIAVSAVIGIGTGVYITRIISKPLVAIANSASQIANGDLTAELIKVKSRDEIGSLGESFNKMTLELKNIIKGIADVSSIMAASSEELSASSEETTASAEQVASTISDLTGKTTEQSHEVINASSILNEISAKIQQSASNSEAVSEASLKVTQTAKLGVEVSKDAVRKIELVEKASIKASEAINLLGVESEKIGQIVDVIVSIAGQTNLLALNAAIEAARAGENGRGFAVVAEEIRKLAEQSSTSAKQITELVANIQKETSHARLVIEESSNQVTEGVAAVNNAGESFEIIVSEIDNVVEEISHVSATTHEIAQNSNEIVRFMENISTISEQNAASSEEVLAISEEQTAAMEEISRSSQELAKLAGQLRETVDKFKY